MREQKVILVNEADEEIGLMEKMEAHEKGVLHRAFSIFIFNAAGQLLLQQRAATKYHGGLLWTNTCCSHPSKGSSLIDCAQKRLAEEMGFTTSLSTIGSFIYKANVENGLTEHELDHVFVGEYQGEVVPNPNEVNDFSYREMNELKNKIALQPAAFTTWFIIVFPKIYAWWLDNYSAKKN